MVQDVHRWVIIDDLMISVTLPGPSDDSVWRAFARDLSTKGVTKYLGTAVGTVEVNSVQRRIVADALKLRRTPCAAVTDDKVVRGFITAVSWMGVDIRAFSWSDLRAAAEFLRVPPENVDKMIEAVTKLGGTPK